VAHANRLPILLLAGDTFANRFPDPVLQQVEHFHAPSSTVNDAFRAVSRYWDRIVRPEHILQSLPQAVATMLDPADCGPAFLGLAQDAQGEAFDYPEGFFEPVVHRIRRLRPDRSELAAAAKALAGARQPLIIAGGGVHYSLATGELAKFAERRGIPVVETIAGRGVLIHDHPANAGPLGVIGSSSANALAAEADVVLAIGTRLQDFTTGSWTVFASPRFQLIALNAARFDAAKHRALSLVGDAREGIAELDAALAGYRAPQAWMDKAHALYAEWNAVVDKATAPDATGSPTYGQVVGAVNRMAGARDRVLTASGGFPGELVKNWKAKSVGSFDCEFGFSCMGYEIAGGWGAKMATPEAEVIVLVGDGAYLMMNSDIYSSVLSGHKMIVVVCDNGGYAVINRLQNFKGGASFNNLIKDCRVAQHAEVDFASHAQSMGAAAETVTSIAELEQALVRARAAPRTAVIVIRIDAFTWTPGDAWWDVGVPAVSPREEVRKASAEHAVGKKKQRLGI
jgi:3D-(3,5/4)-trihydroxycyclohexane-1,2-dione acylhydrolase (decyclizing)